MADYKSELVNGASFSVHYEFPIIRKTEFKPRKAVPFDKALQEKDRKQWVHFYIHDRNFERVWNNPNKYLNLFKQYEGVITTDFSLYREMPLSIQIWNTYRNRVLAYWMQSNEVDIVPNLRWGDERTYDFAFEGIERGGTVAVSTNGTLRKKLDRHYFSKGLEKMVEVIKPDTIINYSYMPDDIFKQYKELGIEVIQIENYNLTVRKSVG